MAFMGLSPIPRSMLRDCVVVRVPDGEGGFKGGRPLGCVRVQTVDVVSEDGHRSTTGGGLMYVDRVNSVGAFEIPVGSRVECRGMDYLVRECRRFEDSDGTCHPWELTLSGALWMSWPPC